MNWNKENTLDIKSNIKTVRDNRILNMKDRITIEPVYKKYNMNWNKENTLDIKSNIKTALDNRILNMKDRITIDPVHKNTI
eukprot:UN33024